MTATITAPDDATTEVTAPAPATEAQAAGQQHKRAALKLRRIIAGRYSGPSDTAEMKERAQLLARGRTTLPENVRGNDGDIFMYLLWAQALDIPEALSFQHVYFSDRGVPGIHAAFMHALLIRAGHSIETLFVDGRKVTLRIKFADGTRSPQVSWHILEAQRAGLHVPGGTKNVWRLYGVDMLWARCISRLCRRHAPDVTGGLHTPEDLADGVDEDADAYAPDEPETDPDGNPVVDDDVKAFLEGVEKKTADELLEMWREAGDMLTRFAGKDENGIFLTVQEALFDAGEVARGREAAAGTLTGGGVEHSETAHLDGMHQADEADAAEAQAEARQVGSGPIGCGCDPEEVAMSGNHREGCLAYVPPLDSQEASA
jgi:hypothetical protein